MSIFLWITILLTCIFPLPIYIFFKMYNNRKKFMEKAKSIHNGMSKTDVLNIMGQPTSWENENDKEILIWKKVNMVEHVGIINFGLKVVIQNGIVTSTSHENLNKSMYW